MLFSMPCKGVGESVTTVNMAIPILPSHNLFFFQLFNKNICIFNTLIYPNKTKSKGKKVSFQ